MYKQIIDDILRKDGLYHLSYRRKIQYLISNYSAVIGMYNIMRYIYMPYNTFYTHSIYIIHSIYIFKISCQWMKQNPDTGMLWSKLIGEVYKYYIKRLDIPSIIEWQLYMKTMGYNYKECSFQIIPYDYVQRKQWSISQFAHYLSVLDYNPDSLYLILIDKRYPINWVLYFANKQKSLDEILKCKSNYLSYMSSIADINDSNLIFSNLYIYYKLHDYMNKYDKKHYQLINHRYKIYRDSHCHSINYYIKASNTIFDNYIKDYDNFINNIKSKITRYCRFNTVFDRYELHYIKFIFLVFPMTVADIMKSKPLLRNKHIIMQLSNIITYKTAVEKHTKACINQYNNQYNLNNHLDNTSNMTFTTALSNNYDYYTNNLNKLNNNPYHCKLIWYYIFYSKDPINILDIKPKLILYWLKLILTHNSHTISKFKRQLIKYLYSTDYKRMKILKYNLIKYLKDSHCINNGDNSSTYDEFYTTLNEHYPYLTLNM